MSKIKVLIVDDSALVRQTLSDLINSDPELEVIGTANDPYAAVEKIAVQKPDVITLDIEMPKMDGLSFLKKIMKQHPIPTVICSSLADEGSEVVIRALELGAIEIIQKPKIGVVDFLTESKIRIIDSIKAAAKANLKKYRPLSNLKVEPKLSSDVVIEKPEKFDFIETTDKVIVIGASTGGTEALRVLLQSMPVDCPGIAIVQHMPENFTRSFAKRLDEICKIDVKEAENGDLIINGRALIAPGNKHMLLKRSGAKYYVEIKDGPLVSRHRPSVDVLFRSAAQYVGKNAYGVILTGMGDDGAKGMLEMKEAGAFNIAQSEESCVVFGMPKEAIELGAVDKVLNLELIAPLLMNLIRKGKL